MKNQASMTALMSAFGRAYHAAQEKEPVFADTIARRLMTGEEYQTLAGYILGGLDFFAPEKKGTFAGDADALRYLVNTQIAPIPVARSRFCEDSLKTALQTGTEQYVILGAGMDTFAFRDPAILERHPVFEVDHPLTQADKTERLRRAGLEIPGNLKFVPADFTAGGLPEKMLAAGFDPGKKTFFSWLGSSYYFTKDQTGTLLDNLAALSAKGSSLVFDYADEGFFSSGVRRVQNMIAMAAAGGEPMKACYRGDELSGLLEKHRFLIYELMTTQDIQKQYFGRFGSDCTAFEHIHFVTAVFQ